MLRLTQISECGRFRLDVWYRRASHRRKDFFFNLLKEVLKQYMVLTCGLKFIYNFALYFSWIFLVIYHECLFSFANVYPFYMNHQSELPGRHGVLQLLKRWVLWPSAVQ